jgi:hypothetical protein
MRFLRNFLRQRAKRLIVTPFLPFFSGNISSGGCDPKPIHTAFRAIVICIEKLILRGEI